MMRRILAMLLTVFLITAMLPLRTYAAGVDLSQTEATEIIEQIKGQLSEAFEDLDKETVGEIFSFVKEKISEGALTSEEGLQRAIEEGEEKFGIEVNPEAARQVVDTMEKLEELGFSSEMLIDRTADLYQQYGADFVEHADEVVKDAVKGAVKKVANSFWDGLKDAVADFFRNLF